MPYRSAHSADTLSPRLVGTMRSSVGSSRVLTDLGREMAEPIRAVGSWVLATLPRIESARERFDAGAREAGAAPRA